MPTMKTVLPFYAVGKVVKGFGRGSKELGTPTANYAEEMVDMLPEEIKTGIYYGMASVDNGPPHKMVMSIGWNPYYENSKKSMETHIIHSFKDDFYGSIMKILVIGYIRPEKNFTSLEELISAIKEDIRIAGEHLSSPGLEALWSHQCFQDKVLDKNINTLSVNVNGKVSETC